MSQDLRTWDAWHLIHQPFEFQWWKEHLDNYRDDAGFEANWKEAKEFIRPSGSIIDIGCGARPPFRAIDHLDVTVIDPLAVEYRKITPPEWWAGIEVYAQPAEYLVEKLIGQGDTVVCWNCLDHTIGWCAILDNMASYSHKNSRLAVATDFWEPFVGHPGYPRELFMAEIEKRFEIVDKREPLGRALALIMKLRA